MGLPASQGVPAEEKSDVELNLVDFAEELVVAELPGNDQCQQSRAYTGIAAPWISTLPLWVVPQRTSRACTSRLSCVSVQSYTLRRGTFALFHIVAPLLLHSASRGSASPQGHQSSAGSPHH